MDEDSTTPGTILLARLQQGSADEPIRVKTEQVALASNPIYSCISLIPSGTDCEIFCNDEPWLVDSAVVDALRALRRTDTETLIWTEELTTAPKEQAGLNASQPPLKTALLNAEDVRLWIGKGDFNTGKAVQLLQGLAEQWRVLAEALKLPENWSQARPQQLMDVIKGVQQLSSSETTTFTGLDDPAVVESANAIAGAAYFRHVKAISSVVLAKKAIVTTKEATMSWTDYCDSLNLLATSGGLLPVKCDIAHMQLVSSIRIAVRRWREDNNSLELLPMLQQSRQADCQDPRDRILALLPIISSSKRVILGHGIAQPPLEVDQSASMSAVFVSAARHIIGERQDLLLWNGIPAPSKPSRLSNLPSWVPDWSDASSVSTLKLRPSMALRSWENAPCVQAAQKPLEITPSGVLKAQAHIFTRVTKVAATPYSDANFQSLLLDNLQMLPPTERLRRRDDYPRTLILDQWPLGNVTATRLMKEFTSFAASCQIYRTLDITQAQLSADPQLLGRVLPPDLNPALRHLFQLISRYNVDALTRALMQALGRRLFVAEHGYLGLGYHEEDGWDEEHRVREGDVIAVFVGGYFPYILRECGRSDDGIAQYKIMGEAHVQGLMEAEGLKDSGWITSTWKDVAIQDVEIV